MPLEPIDNRLMSHFQKLTFNSEDIKGRIICLYGDQGIGKTILSAKLGESNLLITDETGILSLQEHPELDKKTTAIAFTGSDKGNGVGYGNLSLILRACENGQFIGKNGLPVDNAIFDTVSGIVGTEIRRIVTDKDIPTEKGKLSEHLASQPTYFLSEQNFAPLMQMVAQMQNCSATLLSHLRVGAKDIPGASTRPDLHGAVYKLMAKYTSVMGYMHKGGPTGRQIRVMPGEIAAAKTRRSFGKSVVSDDEFVAQIEKWKAGQK